MKAFILAAGFGKRLHPLTATSPKPLVRAGGRPLIEYHIERLVAVGIVDLVINTHWLADMLIDYLGDGSELGANIEWSHEPELLDTGGGIRNALPLLGSEPFVLVNGDVYTEYPFGQLRSRTLGNLLGHLVLVDNPAHNPHGDFCLSASGLLSRVDHEAEAPESSLAREAGKSFTYSGIALLNPQLLVEWPQNSQIFPLREPLLAAIGREQISGERYDGFWEDVGTPGRLDLLNERLR